MKNFKMVCLDIDGTLLNSSHKITQNVKKEINIIANEKQIPVILVSARMPKGIIFLQRELEIEQPIICYSGALILDKNGQILSNEIISSLSLEEIYEVTKKFNVHMSLYKDDDTIYLLYLLTRFVLSEITNIIPTVIDFKNLIYKWKKEGTGPNKILCMSNPDKIINLKESIKNNDLNIYPSKPTYLEIMPSKASKTSAINVLQKKFKVEQSEIIAMGDNYNDVDMIEYAGVGVAMGNAPDEVKKHSNYITSTNDQDGVAKAIIKLILE
ncbi:Cof-type HAD-IIB family hydrolase [Clostridium saccharobutylicum]|uniref:Cof-type HAD-IIB family hydrolase n=1 Tax=Clostridium saccharobutylicum TaxID=169679 RepID=UPI0007E24187|nr:Cof-type HAD-IIB family hydrolase [Clostridium saccharobutylicum]OAV39896.1 hydrolase [Clostridium saccharobutylicum DSM 13864]